MATPAWLGATSGNAAQAAQINQFLGAHACTYVYTGATVSTQATAGSGAVDSNGLYIAQSFGTSTATAAGRVALTVAVTGSPTPVTLSLQASSAGAPSGTPLVSTVVPSSFYSGSAASVSIPLPVTGLSASTTYWIVASAVGDAGDYFAFSKSNQTSGVSTSTNGTSWTAQTYGILYTVYDQTAATPLVHTWEDSGARWTLLAWNANGTPSRIQEYTVAQGTGQFVYSSRSLTYSSTTPPLLTSVA